MTTFTLRIVKGHFVVTGPDIVPMRFETRREAKNTPPGFADQRDCPGTQAQGRQRRPVKRTAPEPTAARGKARAP
jgi:hypothetical protein